MRSIVLASMSKRRKEITDHFLKNFLEIERSLKKRNIFIFAGGFGEEREASLYSGKAVNHELLKNGWKVKMIDPSLNKNWLNSIKSRSIIFNCLHGNFGESGHLPSILDYLKIDYTFSDNYASVVAFDKVYFKSLATKLNMHVPIDNFDTIFKKQTNGLFIHKKIRGGGSIDLSINSHKKNSNDLYFTEQFIPGKILTIGVLESNNAYIPLSAVEIVMKNSQFYDQKSKYEEGFCQYKFYNGRNKEKINEAVIKLCKFLHIKGGARFDLIETQKKKEIYFLEINNVPGLYNTSNFIFSASGLNLSFYQVLIWLLNNAKHNKL